MGDGAEYQDMDKLGLWQVRVAWGRDEWLVFELELPKQKKGQGFMNLDSDYLFITSDWRMEKKKYWLEWVYAMMLTVT